MNNKQPTFKYLESDMHSPAARLLGVVSASQTKSLLGYDLHTDEKEKEWLFMFTQILCKNIVEKCSELSDQLYIDDAMVDDDVFKVYQSSISETLNSHFKIDNIKILE